MFPDKLIEVEQARAEAIFDLLPAAQQAAILERETVVVTVLMTEARFNAIFYMDDDRPPTDDDLPLDDEDIPFLHDDRYGPTKPRRRPTKCFTLERGPRTGQFNLTVTDGMLTRRYEINSRRYDLLVRLANSGNYYVEIYEADYGVAWMIRRKAA